MKRCLYVALLATALFAGSANASTQKGSAAKAGKQLAKLARAADTTAFNTGKVRTRCRTQRSKRRNSFVCRISVQRIYADGSSRTCSDKSVTMRFASRKYRRVQRSYFNRGGYTCGTRTAPVKPDPTKPSAPQHDSPTPIVDLPPAPTEPPVDGAPPGAPPFPFPFASQTARAAQAPSAGASQARTYSFVKWFPYHQYSQYPGVIWTISQWAYASQFCNLYTDYYEYWWWGYNSSTGTNQWTFFGGVYAHSIYGTGTVEYTETPTC
jgi:hypothetical protein